MSARRTRYVVFGEIHGTREGPAFIGTVACGLATRGERLLVAVEHDASNNSALQKAWLLPNAAFPADLRQIGWAGRHDGVGSEAMFELLIRLHALRSEGLSIHVVAFNGFRDDEQRHRFRDLPSQGPREAAQAENIRRAARSGHYDHVLVLVGNLHARKMPVEQGVVRFKPMAMQLGSPVDVTTLNMEVSGGSMWNCLLKPNVTLDRDRPMPPGVMDCGNHEMHRSPVDLSRDAFIRLGTFPGELADQSYDGFFWLGRVNGSPPAAAAF